MSVAASREEHLFSEAIAQPAGERAAFLARACGPDRVLFGRIQALVAAHERPDSRLTPLGVERASALLDEKPGDLIGRYRLLQVIGEGGCGVVWMAEQEVPVRRRIALKVIKLGMDTKAMVARFESERQALAMMDHPNIAKVHDGGLTDTGRPFFVMELVRGIPITKYCDENHLTPTKRLELFINVCHAVQHAHQKGIIHRDLKPSNILISVNDGEPTPKIIDFGIAKATLGKLTDATVFTAFDQFIGTPAYMSPEQAEMGCLDIDTRSDVYSLGILLYELLTGRPPFDPKEFARSGVDEIRHHIRDDDPPKPSARLRTLGEAERSSIARLRSTPPSQLSLIFRGDLDWIVMRCIEKDRTRRYDTANAIATDIQRHLHHEPVVARPPSTGYLIRKLVRRHRLGFAAAAMISCSLIAGFGVSVWSLVKERAARERAVAAERDQIRMRETAQNAQANAEAQELAARRRAYAADMNLVQQALAVDNLGRAQQLLNRQRPEPGKQDLRGWEWRYLWQFCQGDPHTQVCRQPYSIKSLSVSADGKWVAVGGDEGGGLAVINLQTYQEFRPAAGNTLVITAFSPRDPLLAISGTQSRRDGTPGSSFVTLCDLVTQREERRGFPAPCVSLNYSDDGRVLITSTRAPDDSITLWRMPEWEAFATHRAPQLYLSESQYSFAVSADLRLAAHHLPKNRIRVLDLTNGRELWTASAAVEWVAALAFSPDGKILASGEAYTEGGIRLWDVASGTEIGRLQGHRAWVSDLVFWPDGKTMASSSGDQTIRLWDVPGRRHLKTLRGHTTEIWKLALMPNLTLLSGAKDGTVFLWDPTTPEESNPAVTLPAEILSWRFSADSKSVVALERDGQVTEWRGSEFQQRVPRMKLDAIDRFERDFVIALFSPRQPLLAVKTASGGVNVWDWDRGRLVREIRLPADRVVPTAFLREGERLILFAFNPPRYFEWDLVAGREVDSWGTPEEGLFAELFGLFPDETSSIMIGYNGKAIIRDMRTGVSTPCELDIRQARGPKYSPDGRYFAAASSMGLVKLWHATTCLEAAVFSEFSHGTYSVAFSPDSARLVTGSGGVEAIKLWDVATRHHLLTLAGDGSAFRGTNFSPDGNVLGSTSTGNVRVHLWRAPSPDEIEAAESALRSPQ